MQLLKPQEQLSAHPRGAAARNQGAKKRFCAQYGAFNYTLAASKLIANAKPKTQKVGATVHASHGTIVVGLKRSNGKVVGEKKVEASASRNSEGAPLALRIDVRVG